VDLTAGLETVLLSTTSKITALDIQRLDKGLPMIGLKLVLQDLGWDYAVVLLVATRRDCSGWHCVPSISVVPQHVHESARCTRDSALRSCCILESNKTLASFDL
jgi:hypothetical protein